MPDPMTPERRAEIREHLARARDLNVCLDDFHVMLAGDADNLLAEVERLRAEMEETRDTIADPATGYITRLAKTEAERDAARAERDTVLRNYNSLQALAIRLEGERDEARVEAGRLREEAETQGRLRRAEHRDAQHLRTQVTRAEAERDRLAEQVKRAKAAHATTCGVARGLVTAPGVYCSVCAALDGTGDGR